MNNTTTFIIDRVDDTVNEILEDYDIDMNDVEVALREYLEIINEYLLDLEG